MVPACFSFVFLWLCKRFADDGAGRVAVCCNQIAFDPLSGLRRLSLPLALGINSVSVDSVSVEPLAVDSLSVDSLSVDS
eukprot:3637406-Rhodomonas_salina.4